MKPKRRLPHRSPRCVNVPKTSIGAIDSSHGQRNNSNNQSTPLGPYRSDSDIYRDCQYTGRIVKVEGDGRCLFRSLVTCRCPQLQTALRDDFGCPLRQEEALMETQMADELRQQVVMLMAANAQFYSLLGRDVINADVSINPLERYQKFGDRLQAMAKPFTMPGELEINASTAVLELRILVLDVGLRYIYLYGRDKFPEAPICVVRYTRLGPDVGHYDAVLVDIPVDNLAVEFQKQRIDHMEPELEELHARSMKDTSQNSTEPKPNPDSVKIGSHDKSCQTQSNTSLATKGLTTLSEKITTREDTPVVSGEFVAEDKTDALTRTVETICAQCRNLFHTQPSNGNTEPSVLQKSAVVKSNNITKLCSSKYDIMDQRASHKAQRRNQNTSRSGKLLVKRKHSMHKPLASIGTSFPKLKTLQRQSNREKGKQLLAKTKLEHRVKTDHNRRIDQHTASPLTERNIKLQYPSKRKLQNCNANHKMSTPKMRKSVVKGEGQERSSQNSKAHPTNAVKSSITKTNPDGAPKTCFTHNTAPHVLHVPFDKQAVQQPNVSSDNRRICFICLDAMPVSRLLGVQCYICNKMAHRPCVQKYMNWSFNYIDDQYFLCQTCVPL